MESSNDYVTAINCMNKNERYWSKIQIQIVAHLKSLTKDSASIDSKIDRFFYKIVVHSIYSNQQRLPIQKRIP